MKVRQGALTVATPVLEREADRLSKVLAKLARELDEGGESRDARFPLGRIETVHFCRWVLLPRDHPPGEDPYPPRLLFSTNHDGSEAEHLRELVDVAGRGLDEIYSACAGYPAGGSRDPERVVAYLLAHRVPTGAFYSAARGLRAREIVAEARLREEIEAFLDREGPWDGRDVRREVREFARRSPDLAWATLPPRPPTVRERIRHWLPAAGGIGALAILAAGLAATPREWLLPVAVLLLISTLALAFAAIALALFVRIDEEEAIDALERKLGDEAAARRLERHDRVRSLVSLEDRSVQNQLTTIALVRPGRIRQWALRGTLAFVDLRSRYFATRGDLIGIRTIHFARWVIIDGGRRLAFFSNYDGSWERYLDDFIENAVPGLNAIWSHCRDYPRTRFLVSGGAANAAWFKAVVRDRQVPTQIWHGAYPTLSVPNVLSNRRVREGLLRKGPDPGEADWLREL